MTHTIIPSPAKRSKPTLREALQLLDNYVRLSPIADRYRFDETSDVVHDAIFRAVMLDAKRCLRPHKNQMPLPRIVDG